MLKYAWRTYIGENSTTFQENTQKLQWYRSADDPSKLILLYSVEKTNNYDDTGIKHKDRYINTIASDGSKCSGKVTEWVKVARQGTYTPTGILIKD